MLIPQIAVPSPEWRTWTTLEAKPIIGPNPLWESVLDAAKKQHDGLGKADPAYRGNC
jgi:hypothetical protein